MKPVATFSNATAEMLAAASSERDRSVPVDDGSSDLGQTMTLMHARGRYFTWAPDGCSDQLFEGRLERADQMTERVELPAKLGELTFPLELDDGQVRSGRPWLRQRGGNTTARKPSAFTRT